MWKRAMAAAVAGVLISVAPAFAQRVEVGVTFGWVFSDGVELDTPFLAPDGNLYDRADPADSGAWGFNVGFFVTPNAEVGFLFNQQMSKLEADGPGATRELGDMNINTYHGYFGYNFGEPEATIRPYVLLGLGATNFSSVDFTVNGVNREFQGETQFSTTWGAGVKIYPNPRFGVRVGATWTPTYIKSEAGGWWCDPFWGCYLVGDAQYANQLQLLGGAIVRF